VWWWTAESNDIKRHEYSLCDKPGAHSAALGWWHRASSKAANLPGVQSGPKNQASLRVCLQRPLDVIGRLVDTREKG
jgi:hypothetical protein